MKSGLKILNGDKGRMNTFLKPVTKQGRLQTLIIMVFVLSSNASYKSLDEMLMPVIIRAVNCTTQICLGFELLQEYVSQDVVYILGELERELGSQWEVSMRDLEILVAF